jgi:hypothetical protein
MVRNLLDYLTRVLQFQLGIPARESTLTSPWREVDMNVQPDRHTSIFSKDLLNVPLLPADGGTMLPVLIAA